MPPQPVVAGHHFLRKVIYQYPWVEYYLTRLSGIILRLELNHQS